MKITILSLSYVLLSITFTITNMMYDVLEKRNYDWRYARSITNLLVGVVIGICLVCFS